MQREAPRPGETIYRGHRSYDLMRQLQLGVMFSIARPQREAGRSLEEADFAQQVWGGQPPCMHGLLDRRQSSHTVLVTAGCKFVTTACDRCRQAARAHHLLQCVFTGAGRVHAGLSGVHPVRVCHDAACNRNPSNTGSTVVCTVKSSPQGPGWLIAGGDRTVTDAGTQVTQYFPRCEQAASFKWKDYCPAVFSALRAAFGIDNKDYLLSLTGDK